MIFARELKMTLDLLTGTSAEEIALREGLKVARVYYVTGKVKYRVGIAFEVREKNVSAAMVGLYAQRSGKGFGPGWSDTPQGFAYALERERISDAYGGLL